MKANNFIVKKIYSKPCFTNAIYHFLPSSKYSSPMRKDNRSFVNIFIEMGYTSPRRNHCSRLQTPVEIILITRKEARKENGTD